MMVAILHALEARWYHITWCRIHCAAAATRTGSIGSSL